MATLLDYLVTTDPNPGVAGQIATVSVVVWNPGRYVVDCDQIEVFLPKGSDAAMLIGDATTPTAGASGGPGGWTAAVCSGVVKNSVTYVPIRATPGANGKLLAADALTIKVSNMTVSSHGGTATILIEEKAKPAGSHDAYTVRSTSFDVTKTPTALTWDSGTGNPILEFGLSAAQYSHGDAITLKWRYRGSATFKVECGGGAVPDEASKDVSSAHQWTGTIHRDTTFVLSAQEGSTTWHATATVGVRDPDLSPNNFEVKKGLRVFGKAQPVQIPPTESGGTPGRFSNSGDYKHYLYDLKATGDGFVIVSANTDKMYSGSPGQISISTPGDPRDPNNKRHSAAARLYSSRRSGEYGDSDYQDFVHDGLVFWMPLRGQTKYVMGVRCARAEFNCSVTWMPLGGTSSLAITGPTIQLQHGGES